MEKITLKVNRMSCGRCLNPIEGSVGELQGIKLVKVHLETGNVDVEFDPAEVTLSSKRNN
ncbi:copper chaperone [Neobacillus sp. B4I6]|uniref:cation transporter n=1 Tax=Neobacillus sp. B4I6 TaxID=3373925 RepID=UPI003D212E07